MNFFIILRNNRKWLKDDLNHGPYFLSDATVNNNVTWKKERSFRAIFYEISRICFDSDVSDILLHLVGRWFLLQFEGPHVLRPTRPSFALRRFFMAEIRGRLQTRFILWRNKSTRWHMSPSKINLVCVTNVTLKSECFFSFRL